MVVKVDNLKKSFRHPWNLKKIEILKGVTFEVAKPSIVGFLGGNGAGKTTTIKSLLGLISVDSGEISIFDSPMSDLRTRNKIGYLPERPFFYRHLSGQEFLEFYGKLSLNWKKSDLHQRINDLLNLVDLEHARHRLLKNYSKGMLQRIGMAQALIHRPQLLILDEPLSGLDPDGRYRMAEIIESVFLEGTSVFFSSHLLDDVEKLCKDLVVLREGVIQYNGGKSEFLESGERHYNLSYGLAGKLVVEKLPDIAQVQAKIDELREKKINIVDVRLNRASLEEAYKSFHSG